MLCSNYNDITNNKKYKLIILIISSNNIDAYIEMKKLTDIYMRLYKDEIKYFFIEFDQELQQSIKETENTLYFKGIESTIPGIFQKTIYAMEYININYDYEFVVKTNLSSFFHIENLLKYLSSIPKENFAGGFDCFGAFITGTGIFLSRDASNKLVDIGKYHLNSDAFDDVLITQLLRAYSIPIYYIGNEYKWTHFTDDKLSENNPYNEDIEYPDNTLYFRIKYGPDRNIDIMYFKLLLKRIYGIE